MDTIPSAMEPLLPDTVALMEAAARELTRVVSSITVAKVLIDEAARREWPYDDEDPIPAEDAWKRPGTGALLDLSSALDDVLRALRRDRLADPERYYLKIWEEFSAPEVEDLPF